MSLAVVYSRANVGIEAQLVEVEVHLSNGLPGFSIVGLPEAVVKESKDRVRSAIINCNFNFPLRRITVNLAPADLPKEGGRYDLAIALGILCASKQIDKEKLNQYEMGGELALSGGLRAFTGALPMVIAANKSQRSIILPEKNAARCAFVHDANILQANHLLDVCRHFQGLSPLTKVRVTDLPQLQNDYADISEVRGQHQAKRALEIAASGAHSILMIGSPGAGKTMLAHRLPGLLPAMRDEQALEVAAIHSLKGKAIDCYSYGATRPFRSPHHSLSSVAMVGGGRKPLPGEVSLAHQGVLFLDEFPEFNRACLEALREPLESGEVMVSRAAYSVRYPAKFQLVAAMNPCPCGYYADEGERCQCSVDQVRRYQSKISGPLLDRIDLRVMMRPVAVKQLLNPAANKTESSAEVRLRVSHAQQTQFDRSQKLNQMLTNSELNSVCGLSQNDQQYMEEAITKLGLSARAYHRVLKVARTIADLDQQENIARAHLQEALIFRSSGYSG